jgi:PAS domain-containing protein
VLDIATGQFVDCNQKACEMFGVSVTGIRSLGVLDISPPLQPDGRESRDAGTALPGRGDSGGRPGVRVGAPDAGGARFPCEITLFKLPDPRSAC